MRKNTTRRAILAGAATLSALAMPAAAQCYAVDPIFAAIDRHRTADAEFCRHVRKHWALEETIPSETRVNDPRWTQSEAEYLTLEDRNDDAELGLISIQPTTMPGVVALLRYMAQYEIKSQFMDTVINNAGVEESWHTAVQHHIADSIEAIYLQS